MALIAMACFDNEQNKRAEYTRKTLQSIAETVNLSKHRLIVVDNNSCEETKDLLKYFCKYHERLNISVITLPENIGTARAINQAWKLRKEGEHCIKMDNDVVIHSSGWVDEMEEAIRRDNKIGQVALKRKDCWEHPKHESDDYKSELIMLPHVGGERWQIVEKAKHIIGTCVMHSSDLLDKVGYLYQPSLYGYDDVLASHRAHLAGFYSCFLTHINIDHIDDGKTEYQGWKERHSGEQTQNVIQLVHDMYNGVKPIYYGAEY